MILSTNLENYLPLHVSQIWSRANEWLTAGIFINRFFKIAVHCVFIDDANDRKGEKKRMQSNHLH